MLYHAHIVLFHIKMAYGVPTCIREIYTANDLIYRVVSKYAIGCIHGSTFFLAGVIIGNATVVHL